MALNDGPAVAGQPVPIAGLPDGVLNPFLNFPPLFGFGSLYRPENGLAFSGVERDLTLFSVLGEFDVGDSGHLLTASFSFRDEDLKTGSDSDHGPVNFFFGNDTSVECGFLCASGREQFDDYSLEVRYFSPQEEQLRWMVGAFYYTQDEEERDITFARPNGEDVDTLAQTRNRALYGYIEYDFSENLTASIEGRYASEDKELDEFGGFFGNRNFDNFTPRATIDWQATDDILWYGVYSKGVKPGGFNGAAGADRGQPTYDEEESDNFELGMKGLFLDGRLVANLALFFIDVEDVQLTTPLSSASGTLTSIATNQGSGEVKGIEAELRYAASENLTLGFNYALADTEFTEGCDDMQWTLTSGGGILNLSNIALSTDFTGQGDCSIAGNQFPLSSKHQASASFDFRKPSGMWDGGTLFFSGDVSYESKRYAQVHNLAYAPAATLVGMRLGLETENWTVALYGRNLTDEDSPSIVTRWLQNPLIAGLTPTVAGVPTDGSASVSFPRAFFGDMRRQRQIGVELTYAF